MSLPIRLEPRERPLPAAQVVALVGGIGLALVVGAILLAVTGHDPFAVYRLMARSAVGSVRGWGETLNRAVPLTLAGLAVATAYAARLWNIGAEGQLFVGAIAAAGVARLGADWPGPLLIAAMLLAGFAGGLLWAAGPAIARSWLDVNEIITTLLLNYVAILWVLYLVHGPWRDPASLNFPLATPIPDQAHLPTLFGRAHLGVVVAVVITGLLAAALARTPWGYELRLTGASSATAAYAGIPIRRTMAIALALSGGLAGIAGAVELAGTAGRLAEGLSPSYGYTAIIVASLAAMRPWGVAAVATIFGAVLVGGGAIQTLGVSAALAAILQALILFGAIAAGVLTRYRLRVEVRRPTLVAEEPAGG